jgi:tetratricopeptide (TPR) repeat protein|tara:strand:- start:9951 stop:12350 length:2400 start_codon:yes stop_codon:yes gene_type:complete
MLFLSCSTKKNKSLNRSYHSVVSSYNVLFNGESSIEEGLLQTQESFVDNFWEFLPIEKINLSKEIITVDGIGNEKFLKSEEKAAKTIQKHSMLINNVQYNSKIAQAYLLLGRARYLDQRFIPALDAFNQVYKQNIIVDEWYHSVIWKAKCNIRLEQEELAIELLKNLLKKEKLSAKVKADANSVLAMAYLQLQKNDLAINPLKTASSNEKNKQYKARYLFILGQIYEKKFQNDSAYSTFNKVVNFNRSIPRDLLINAKIKTLIYNPLNKNEREISKIIDNIENKPYLDKIYYGYSNMLFLKDSVSKAEYYLNKAIKENPSDKDLLSRGYEQISKINFNKSNYVLSGKYLDSTLNNLEKNSKKYWELERRRKGLDRVVQLEENINLYDSLLKLSSYEPSKLNKVLNQIKDKKKKPKPKKKTGPVRNNKTRTGNSSRPNFYFYDTKLVELGKKSFETIWGQRTRESYWRNVSSKPTTVSKKKEEIDEKNIILEETEPVNNDLLATIPRTNFQKDSINHLKNKSYLRLAEIYLEKYSDYSLTKTKLNQLRRLNPSNEILVEANYILYKVQKKQNKKNAEEIRLQIIKQFPDSKFAKILADQNILIAEEGETLKQLDSFYTLYDDQKFQQVLVGVEKGMVFIENKEILLEFDLLKAKTIGKLEGVIKYSEQIKNIIDRYPNSSKVADLKELIRAINLKWKTKPTKKILSNYNIVFYLENLKTPNDSLIKKVKDITLNKFRVSVDVYDLSTKLLVVRDLESKEKANEVVENIKEKLESLRLNNNFVVLSSQYKNILIYKDLDLN